MSEIRKATCHCGSVELEIRKANRDAVYCEGGGLIRVPFSGDQRSTPPNRLIERIPKRNTMKPTITRVAIAAVILFSLAASHLAEAQQAQVARIGVIANGSPEASAGSIDAFRQRLRELGYVEGRNLAIELRYPDELGHAEALPELNRRIAAELVALRVDVIVAPGTLAVRAAKEVTSAIPIVMVHVGDAVGAGLVKSLPRPGGNITGQSFLGPEMAVKELDLLTEVLPRGKRFAVIFNPGITPKRSAALGVAAQARGVALEFVEFRRPDDLALAAMGQARPNALIVVAVTGTQLMQIVEYAAKNRLPAVYGFRDAVDAGGLMSFGPRRLDLWRGAANYVDRILKGAKPGDLPVEQPTRFELVVNLKTAKALGLSIPASVLARADQVIE
jgi:putative ABC transport system substrate-binding protein